MAKLLSESADGSLADQAPFVLPNEQKQTSLPPSLLEGALLEARASQTSTARRIFKFLLQQAPRYGPVFVGSCEVTLADEAEQRLAMSCRTSAAMPVGRTWQVLPSGAPKFTSR